MGGRGDGDGNWEGGREKHTSIRALACWREASCRSWCMMCCLTSVEDWGADGEDEDEEKGLKESIVRGLSGVRMERARVVDYVRFRVFLWSITKRSTV
jgi:hypothetical protein